MSSLITRLALALGLLFGGCGSLTETNYDGGAVSSTETVEYDDGNARVVNKQVDPMMPYGDSEEGIRRAEDFDLLEAPPQ
jgi:hypothetical protein